MVRILPTGNLLPELKNQLKTAEHVDIYVAWATGAPPAREILDWAKRPGRTLRAIIGTTGRITGHAILRDFMSAGSLQLRSQPKGCFHPKVYLFRANGHTTALIGSPNLTGRAFSDNTEVAALISDESDDFTRFFQARWSEGRIATTADIDKYEARLKAERLKPGYVASKDEAEPSNRLELLSPDANVDWKQYLSALKQCDALWTSEDWPHTIFSNTYNYLNAIEHIQAILGGLGESPWPIDHIRQVFGVVLERDKSTIDGRYVLGRMHRPYTRLLATLAGDSNAGGMLRRKITTGLKDIRTAPPEQIPGLAAEFMDSLRAPNNPGIDVWPSLSSRFLALMRPDVCVSSNTRSRPGLHYLFLNGQRADLSKGAGYKRLLEAIQTRRWWRSGTPSQPDFDIRLFKYRAALLDAFVYDWS